MASPAGSMQRSHGSSSAASLKRSPEARPAPSVPVETLVTHLLAAKRSLSSMTLVLRANEIATACRSAHEDASILAAQTAFLRTATHDQAGILVRIRRSLQATYDWGSKDFKRLVRTMDEVDGDLERTMEMLRGTEVQSVLRPKDEESKCLLDFVDEDSVDGMRQVMKKSIQELQGIQQSFDGDLLRFDTDIRGLKKAITDSSAAADEDNAAVEMPGLLLSVVENSSGMAQLLASLTTHFDMCVTAIRTTEGGAALARHRAAETQQQQNNTSNPDGVSISGVIAEQESNAPDLEPKTERDRAEMLRVVVQDAEEVDDVVREIQQRLTAMEHDHTLLQQRRDAAQAAYVAILEAYASLSGIADRLPDYLASETDFKTRWDLEKDAIFSKLDEMKDMRGFYEGYASAYDGLLLEIERRNSVQDRVKSIWRTAQDSVDKLLDADAASREAFRQDVGEFLPTDLWPGLHLAPKRWKVSRVKSSDEHKGHESNSGHGDQSTGQAVE